MGDPRIVDGFDLRTSTPELHLLWDQGTGRGAKLPASYFAMVSISDRGISRELVVSAEQVAPREILIRLAPAILTEHLEDAELTFTLAFPDRRASIDCEHPATSDNYYVDITLALQEGMHVGTTIKQWVSLGSF